MTRQPLLEVIACSVGDAVAAARGGAGRLEVISNLEVGGLTPEISIVERVLQAVQIPVRVMLRQSPNFDAESGRSRLRLLELAQALGQLPIEGFVLGFLRDREVDEDALAELLACAPHLRVTFHRAFEEVKSVTQAMTELKRHSQIDRILTSGGAGEWIVRAEKLAGIERLARPEIQLLCGGGLDEKAIGIISAATLIKEFHVGRLARTPAEVGGAVDAEKVRRLVRLIGYREPGQWPRDDQD